jgi:hypothetical protein
LPTPSLAQIDKGQLGAWHIYYWNTQYNNSPRALHGDVQHRKGDSIGDLERLLIKGDVTYTPQASKVMFTIDYADISSGELGSSSPTSSED